MSTHLTEGARVPAVVFKVRPSEGFVCGDNSAKWQELSTKEVFDGKKVVVFALPGAFTPTCSSTHAPGYDATYDEFKKLGVDEVYCLSVNDSFVMNQWAQMLGIKHVKMLPDGNTSFTRAMGMLVKKDNLGFGERSWRYSMFVDDGVIKKMFVEPGFSDNYPDDPFEVSDAGTMIAYLRDEAH
jgi:peroxiredoxin